MTQETRGQLEVPGIRVVILLGAGASRPEPVGRPVMSEFLRSLAPGGDIWKSARHGGHNLGSPGYQGLMRLAAALGEESADEGVFSVNLEVMARWLDAALALPEQLGGDRGVEALLRWPVTTESACEDWQKAQKLFAHASPASEIVERTLDMWRATRDYLRSGIWHAYAGVKRSHSLEVHGGCIGGLLDIAASLVGAARRVMCPVGIFTTNYDRAIEELGAPVGPARVLAGRSGRRGPLLADGFEPRGERQRWSEEYLRRQMEDPSAFASNALYAVAYFKLHGSLDWQIESDGVWRTGREQEPEAGEAFRAGMMYPGDAHRPSDEPFHSSHAALRNALNVAPVALCVGFSFREDELADMFWEGLNADERLSLVLVDPAGEELAAEDSRFGRLWNHERTLAVPLPYGNDETTEQILKHVRSVLIRNRDLL